MHSSKRESFDLFLSTAVISKITNFRKLFLANYCCCRLKRKDEKGYYITRLYDFRRPFYPTEQNNCARKSNTGQWEKREVSIELFHTSDFTISCFSVKIAKCHDGQI